MNKKSWQILSLIISVLGLIYMFLSYYGIIRFIKLHMTDSIFYTEKFTKKEKGDKYTKISIFSPVKKEEAYRLKPFINSLLDQSVKINDITLICENKEDIWKDIDPEIKKILSINTHSEKNNDIGTFVFSLLKENKEDTNILVLNPGKVYGEDYIETLLEKGEKEDIVYEDENYLMKPKCFKLKDLYNIKEDCVKDLLETLAKTNSLRSEKIEYNLNYNILDFLL